MVTYGPETRGDQRHWVVNRTLKAVLFVDIVESVRLFELDETGTITKWVELVNHIVLDTIPRHHGRMVKSTGDGLLLEFDEVRHAVEAAFDIQQANRSLNDGRPDEGRIFLRMGIDADDVIIERNDIYGRGVNLAARLMSLAGRDEVIISTGARARLTASLDAEVEDLGECYLRHIREPVRAYRIGPPGPTPIFHSCSSAEDLLPSIAVIPFKGLVAEPENLIIGDILADETIATLSQNPNLTVISRLSTTAFSGRVIDHHHIRNFLKADYLVAGVYRCVNQKILLDVELTDAKTGNILWSDRISAAISGVFDGSQDMINALVTSIGQAIVLRELQLSRSRPLPTLKACTLLIGAIALMHRLSRADFQRAEALLHALVDRGGGQPVPNAWLANWHVLRVQQGWSDEPKRDTYLAMECTKRALDADPDCVLALTVDGFVHTNLLKSLDIGQERYDRALEISPNFSLAWLLRGTLAAFKGEGRQAVEDTQRALALSPLDPHRYFYDSLAASAFFAAGDYALSLQLAQQSLRANRTHTSTLRVLAVSHWQLGQYEQAQAVGRSLLNLEPALTVSGWLRRSPSAQFEVGRRFADLLRQVGIPD